MSRLTVCDNKTQTKKRETIWRWRVRIVKISDRGQIRKQQPPENDERCKYTREKQEERKKARNLFARMRFQRPDKTKHTTPDPDQDRFVLVCVCGYKLTRSVKFHADSSIPASRLPNQLFWTFEPTVPPLEPSVKIDSCQNWENVASSLFFSIPIWQPCRFRKVLQKSGPRWSPQGKSVLQGDDLQARTHTFTRNTHADAGSSRSRFLLKISSKVLTLNETVAAAAHTSFKGRTKAKNLLLFFVRGEEDFGLMFCFCSPLQEISQGGLLKLNLGTSHLGRRGLPTL